MPIEARDIETLIREAFPNAKISVQGDDWGAFRGGSDRRIVPGPEPGAAAAGGLCGAEGQDGRLARRIACAGADDQGAGVTTPGAVLLGIVALVLCGIALEYRLRRGKTRPMARRFTKRPEATNLGMEATDADRVAGMLLRNAALAAKTRSSGAAANWVATGAIPPRSSPDDAD